jgi:hypothetical protein
MHRDEAREILRGEDFVLPHEAVIIHLHQRRAVKAMEAVDNWKRDGIVESCRKVDVDVAVWIVQERVRERQSYVRRDPDWVRKRLSTA